MTELVHCLSAPAYSVSALRDQLAEPIASACATRGLHAGDRVLIKPNLVGPYAPEAAVTTHPAVVAAVAELLTDAGLNIWLGESPSCPAPFAEVLDKCGLSPVVKRYGLKPIELGSKGTLIREGETGPHLLSRIPFEVDGIFAIAKLKTHLFTLYTGAIKNLFGCVPGQRKRVYHRRTPSLEAFSARLADLYQIIAPQVALHVIDGIIGMEGAGPTEGHPRAFGRLVVAQDGAAADVVGAGLLGFDPNDILHLRPVAPQVHLVPGPIVDVIRPQHTQAIKVVMPALAYGFGRLLWMRVFIDSSRCTPCEDCQTACPTKAITRGTRVRVDQDACIQCMRCHDVCPDDAVVVRRSPVLRTLKAVNQSLKPITQRFSR